MKPLMFFLTFAFFSFSSIGYAEELTEEKKKQIDELLQMTGASQIGSMLAGAFIQDINGVLKKSNPDIEPRAFEIVKEEVMAQIHDELVNKNSFNAMIYPIYHKYLTTQDLGELIQFYKTPIGQKAIKIMPMVAQESTIVGRKWGQSLAPKIRERIQKRLEKEGIGQKG